MSFLHGRQMDHPSLQERQGDESCTASTAADLTEWKHVSRGLKFILYALVQAQTHNSIPGRWPSM